MDMRSAVIALKEMGPLPSSDLLGENLAELLGKYSALLESIQKPVTDDEARVLVTLFGPDDCFGLIWPLIHLIETAPGWPLQDCLKNTDQEWIQMLRQRVENDRAG